MKREERIKLLESAIAKNQKIALYIAEDNSTALFRYQCQNLQEYTVKKSNWKVIWFLNKEIQEIKPYVKKVDLVVVLRQAAKRRSILNFIQEVQSAGKEVLFSLDDLVFNYGDISILRETTHEKNWLYWIGYFWGIRRIAKRVDGFIVTNEFLGKKLQKSFNRPYVVIPNSLNDEQVENAKKCIEEKRRKDRKKFEIGYFSGSPTHARDFALVEPEILRFLDNHEDAMLKIVGYMKLSEQAQEYVHRGKIKCYPAVDYLKLEREIAGVDVNIAPLVINDFTNCKSELKFFEAGVVETTTIASPIYTFRHAIKNGENGFLTEPGRWYEKLDYLYKRPEENHRIAENARKYALKHYYGKEFLRGVESAYDKILEEL